MDNRYGDRRFTWRPEDEVHIGPTTTYDEAICLVFQNDITTLQLQGYDISYNRHTTALNTIQQRKIHVRVQTTIKFLVANRKSSIPITTWIQALCRDPPN